MGTVIELGFAISHEFEGGKAKNSYKKITVKEYIGRGDSSNVVHLSGSSGGYGTMQVAGKTYKNAKLLDQSSSYEGELQFKQYTIEQKIDGNSGCIIFAGLTASQIESFSHSIQTSKTKTSASYTRSYSVKIADKDELSSQPKSPSGSALIDKAVAGMSAALSSAPSFTSTDSDINDLIANAANPCDSENKYKKSTTSSIDKVACSASKSETVTKSLEEDDCCITSETVSTSKDQTTGMTTITISGDIAGGCQTFSGCGDSRAISKTKYDFAEECFDAIDLKGDLEDEYDSAHKQEECEGDVCLAFVMTSKSETHCVEQGTISYSATGTEEEVYEEADGASLVTEEQTSVNGCLSDMTRTFDISAPINQDFVQKNPAYIVGDCATVDQTAEEAMGKVRAKLGSVDFDPPADFFGPLSLSLSECPSKATMNGSMSFSNDPQYEDADDPDTFIKKKTTTCTVCSKEIEDKKFKIPCGNPIVQKLTRTPGYTRCCVDVEAYPCATVAEVLSEASITVPAGAEITEQTTSVSVQSGAKTASKCVAYHTKEDLDECE